MKKNNIDLNPYLKRINYSGEIRPTIDLLETLHQSQIYTIPFENFDILLDRGISRDPDRLFEKLVNTARGGYCFELNGLFLRVLKAIGFNARALLARVHLTGIPSGRGHQISLVTLQGRQWIADVGFGSQSLRSPIPFELDQPATQDGLTFRLVGAGNFGTMLQTLTDRQWVDLYSFDLAYVFPNDILYGNHFTSTHPSDFFTFTRVAALPLTNGSITLLNRTLKKKTGDFEQVWELEEGQAYLDALKNHFGIELDAPYEHLRPLPES